MKTKIKLPQQLNGRIHVGDTIDCLFPCSSIITAMGNVIVTPVTESPKRISIIDKDGLNIDYRGKPNPNIENCGVSAKAKLCGVVSEIEWLEELGQVLASVEAEIVFTL